MGLSRSQESEAWKRRGCSWRPAWTGSAFPCDWISIPEDLSAEEVSGIIASLGMGDRAVLITYLVKATEIAGLAAMLGCRRVQLHGDITAGEVRLLKNSDPGLFLIKSLVVRPGNIDELAGIAGDFGPLVDAFITDTWDPKTGASGATGKTHDWDASRRIVESAARPVILAGGLTPANVGRAIVQVRPEGVDAHTGVEGADGMKDPIRVRAFVEEARRAFALLKRKEFRS